MSNKFERNGQDVPGLKFCYVPQSRKIRNVNANWSSFYADVSHRRKNNGKAKNTTIRFLNRQNEASWIVDKFDSRWIHYAITAFYKRACVHPESCFGNRSTNLPINISKKSVVSCVFFNLLSIFPASFWVSFVCTSSLISYFRHCYKQSPFFVKKKKNRKAWACAILQIIRYF